MPILKGRSGEKFRRFECSYHYQNVVTYDIVIQLGNKELKLKPGMTANVSILIAHREGVLKIPNAALRFQPSSVKREEGGEKKKKGSSETGQVLTERLNRELSLTEEQRPKVETALKASSQEIQQIREKAKPEEARNRIQSLLRQKIWGILTEEQRRKFDELSKSSLGEERQPRRVWILSPEGKPVPVRIVLGITNGTHSQVASDDLQEGMEVIVEETSAKKDQSKSGTSSPFGRGVGKK
jgi:HlyD family secretion protein